MYPPPGLTPLGLPACPPRAVGNGASPIGVRMDQLLGYRLKDRALSGAEHSARHDPVECSFIEDADDPGREAHPPVALEFLKAHVDSLPAGTHG